MSRCFKIIDSPVGRLRLIAHGEKLAGVTWEREEPGHIQLESGEEQPDHPTLLLTEQQLQEYFAGERENFSLDLEFEGSDFQKQVWEALLCIPYGVTRTYGDIARQIGNPDSVRAVGGAANKNPIAIIAPCHRVIGASGQLVGFGGGLANKTILLQLESRKTQPQLF